MLCRLTFTLRLHCLFDLLALVSHFAISVQTYDSLRSWLDFGFVRSYILYVVVDQLFTRYRNKTFFTQVLLLVFKVLCLVFFAAAVLFSLERLGDLPYTNSYLLHVYKCYNDDGTKYLLMRNNTGTPEYADCSETWSFFSAVYFMFVTVSTVGYGDFAPKTVLGQLMVCVIIIFGIYTFANESAAFMTLYGDQRSGHIKYNVSRNTLHVVVTGNPSAAQMKDFIREFFHPDHEADFHTDNFVAETKDAPHAETKSKNVIQKSDDEASYLEDGQHSSMSRQYSGTTKNSQLITSWMKRRRGASRIRETHIVVLMRFDLDDETHSFQKEVMEFVAANPRYHKRVFLIYGSSLRQKDLKAARVQQAMACFFLPNKFASDGDKEDAATVLRVLSVSQYLQDVDGTQLFAMLVNSDNRTLVEATGMPSDHLVCADELRLGLMGLSCRCAGLSTLVSNLITSRSADFPMGIEPTAYDHQQWVAEYVTGAANEIYSCYLAPHFVGANFTQAAQRIHRQSDGLVLLIAVEAEGDIAFNPGKKFRLHAACKAYMIAESMTSLEPFAGSPPSMFSNPMLTNSVLRRGRNKLVKRARRAQHEVERRIPAHIRAQIEREQRHELDGSSGKPKLPPRSLLARGGHIVVCSNSAHDSGSQRSISRLVNFLRPLRAPHIEKIAPVVLVDAQPFDARSWSVISDFGEVYQVQGSPQRHHVLSSAGVYSASAIVVLAQGTELGYDDSKAIFTAILVSSALQNRNIFTIIELRDVHNNKFLDPVTNFSSVFNPNAYDEDEETSRSLSMYDTLPPRRDFSNSLGVVNVLRTSESAILAARPHDGSITSMRPSNHMRRFSSLSPTRKKTWWNRQRIRSHEIYSQLHTFFFSGFHASKPPSKPAQAMRSSFSKDVSNNNGGENSQNVESKTYHDDEDDTFFQERFMRGALFPSYVADDLLVQSFFNPSLNMFIRKILDGKSCFMLYDVPKPWRANRLTYGELFASMASGVAHALPIGLLRAQGGVLGAPHAYVYTCPPSSTVVYPGDKVFVIIDVETLHRVANKLQRSFRRRKAQRESR